ncbi:tail fiber domain-containing protein, partial [Paramuribaculum intestinale]|uniref:tail fiber domain-containing protein n=3 Tax=Paramuribaculum intestinale TaxID=2094151 RepID=UPI00272B47F6
MGLINKPSLLYDASVIRNERADYHNTAERVGAMIVDLINAIDSSLVGVDDQVAAAVKKALGDLDLSGSEVDLSAYLPRSEFDEMFERVEMDGGGWYILAKSHLVSVGDVTVYGNGGPGGGGVTELRCLDDVILTNPKAGQGLKYDGQHWVNGTIDAGLDEAALAAYLQTNRYAKLSDIPSLADYATRSWVEDKGYATEAWVIAQRYLTEHQDISHLLTRAEFEAMFERIDTDGGGWYILAKSHLASVGDVTAYGTGGPGSTLGGIGDVQLGSLAAGDVIKWDGQHWVNGPAPAGGIDESVLANYVTLDTEQEIRGHKRFAHNDTDFSHRITINGSFESDIHHHPQVMWHVSNRRWTKAVMDTWGNIHLLEGSAGTFDGAHQGLVASKFAKPDGTASQVLMADGSVQTLWRAAEVTTATTDSGMITPLGLNQWTSANFYKKTDADARFVNVTGDTMTGPLRIAHSATNCVLYTQYNTAGAYSNVIWANVDESRVLFGSPHWITVELETANSATAAYRRTNGVQYKIWDSGNHGHTSGLNADLLDGHHGWDFFRHGAGYISSDYFNGTAFQNLAPGAYIYGYGAASGLLVSFGNIGASASSLELYTTYPDETDIRYRKKIDSNRFAGGWNTLITNRNIWAYNAGSATKLQTARSLWGNSFNGEAGCGGGLTFDPLTGANARNLLYQKMADNDFFRIRCGGSASNAGWVEIATADDGTEPIYVRQYTGEFVSITRTLTLLDGSGNTYLPGHLVASGDVTAYSDARLKSDVQTLRNRGYITPRTYIKDGKRCIGFLAQEVQQRYPEL